MSRESSIAAALRARISKKKAELTTIDADLDKVQDQVAELTVRRTAIVAGIDEDEALLKKSAPKTPRTKKQPQTIGDQIGQSAREESRGD